MKRPKRNGIDQIDEHNQTTEPFNFGVSPYAPTVTGNRLPPDTSPIAIVRPGSQQQGPPQPPLIGAYPFLPPSPTRQNGKAVSPAGSVTPPQAGGSRSFVPGSRRLRKLFPPLVGLCFVVIQVLLLVSFGFKIVGHWDSTLWANVLYVISDVFIWPVQALVSLLPLPFAVPAQIVTLLAILLYGMISRVVVRSLKFLLREHSV
ncbi:MAG: hypothetical protein JO011_09020 [Ktedonobacteraceae bacterium]|nr:hypothetical protein [Ktedonobacteraceae bacterium]